MTWTQSSSSSSPRNFPLLYLLTTSFSPRLMNCLWMIQRPSIWKSSRETSTANSTLNSAELSCSEERHQLWSNSNCVVEEMDTLSAVSDKTSPSFRSMFENFSNNCKPFLNSARAHHTHPAFRERLQSLCVARDKLCRHACTSSESSSPVLSFPHPSCSIPKGASIPVKVPSFDGNPFHWEKFESELSTAIRTRAPHYSNFDVHCLLTESVVPVKAKNIIKHRPDREAPLADLLRALKREFGTPVIVGPILIEKLLTHNTYDLDYSGFSNLSEHFIQPYDSLFP